MAKILIAAHRVPGTECTVTIVYVSAGWHGAGRPEKPYLIYRELHGETFTTWEYRATRTEDEARRLANALWTEAVQRRNLLKPQPAPYVTCPSCAAQVSQDRFGAHIELCAEPALS